jgi:hypothetical protein
MNEHYSIGLMVEYREEKLRCLYNECGAELTSYKALMEETEFRMQLAKKPYPKSPHPNTWRPNTHYI